MAEGKTYLKRYLGWKVVKIASVEEGIEIERIYRPDQFDQLVFDSEEHKASYARGAKAKSHASHPTVAKYTEEYFEAVPVPLDEINTIVRVRLEEMAEKREKDERARKEADYEKLRVELGK